MERRAASGRPSSRLLGRPTDRQAYLLSPGHRGDSRRSRRAGHTGWEGCDLSERQGHGARAGHPSAPCYPLAPSAQSASEPEARAPSGHLPGVLGSMSPQAVERADWLERSRSGSQ